MFEIGRRYRRSELHDEFGGNRRGGISPSRRQPFIFLFTGKHGIDFGYYDGWNDDGTFRYFGEGQVGDMTLIRGNLAIQDHAENAKELHLFESAGEGFVRYVGQMTCAGSEIRRDTPDRKGNLRKALVFHLVPSSDVDDDIEHEEPVDPSGISIPTGWYWEAPINEIQTRHFRHHSQTLQLLLQNVICPIEVMQ